MTEIKKWTRKQIIRIFEKKKVAENIEPYDPFSQLASYGDTPPNLEIIPAEKLLSPDLGLGGTEDLAIEHLKKSPSLVRDARKRDKQAMSYSTTYGKVLLIGFGLPLTAFGVVKLTEHLLDMHPEEPEISQKLEKENFIGRARFNFLRDFKKTAGFVDDTKKRLIKAFKDSSPNS